MKLSILPGVEQNLRMNIRSAHDSFKDQIDYYYNSDFLDIWLYKDVAFLDPRAFYVLTPAQWPSVFEHMKSLCLDEEIFPRTSFTKEKKQSVIPDSWEMPGEDLFNLLGALQKKRLSQLSKAVLYNILK